MEKILSFLLIPHPHVRVCSFLKNPSQYAHKFVSHEKMLGKNTYQFLEHVLKKFRACWMHQNFLEFGLIWIFSTEISFNFWYINFKTYNSPLLLNKNAYETEKMETKRNEKASMNCFTLFFFFFFKRTCRENKKQLMDLNWKTITN